MSKVSCFGQKVHDSAKFWLFLWTTSNVTTLAKMSTQIRKAGSELCTVFSSRVLRLRLRLRLFIDLTEVQTTVLSMFTNRIQNTKINKFIMLAMASIKIDSKY